MTESPYRDPAVAEVYRRVAVPTHFVRPARDLATMMTVAAGDRVLDVGTGTGAFASAAAEIVGGSGLSVGLDRAPAMLRASDHLRDHPLVVGETPGLPFLDEAFDVVGASFVLPHCRDRASALADMTRVCRSGGRVGITAWGGLPNGAAELWRQIVDTYVDADELRQAFRAMVPWEEWFYLACNLGRTLQDAGLTAIQVETRQYTIDISPADYVSLKKAGVEGRLIRELAGEIAWNDLSRQINVKFRERFPGSITFVRDVHFGVGTKP